MWRAFILVGGALFACGLNLLYFSLPAAFLIQLNLTSCFRASGWHTLWTLTALLGPLLAPVLLWQASRELRQKPKDPVFSLHIAVQFFAGLLLASGFFALRLLWRLDSPLLQATLFTGYVLTLDLCTAVLGWRRLPRNVWLVLSFVAAAGGAYYLQKYPPVVREADLGSMRLKLLGRTVLSRPVAVCMSPEALARVNWNADALRKVDLHGACLAWPHRLELPQVFESCVNAPVRPAPPSEPLPEESVLVEGDPKIGEARILGQVHQREDDTPQQRWSIVESQRLIHQEILKHSGWPVFHEGTCQGPSAAMASSPGIPGLGGDWSPAFFEILLASLGAVGTLEEAGQLTSRPTSRCDDPKLAELEQLEAQVEMTDPQAPQYESLYARMEEIRMEYRETQAAQFLSRYWQRHPGDKVLLVYGEAHQFPEPVWRAVFGAKLPRVVQVKWSTAVGAQWDLEALDQPVERLAQVAKAAGFPVSALGAVRNREELFTMLPKLKPEPLRDITPEDLTRRLTGMLDAVPFRLPAEEHLQISEWLWHCRRKGVGPFTGYRLEREQESWRLGQLTGPYQQLVWIRKRSRVPLADYRDIILPEARLEALAKLDVPKALANEEVKEYLDAANSMVVDMGGKLAKEVEKRFGGAGNPAEN
jgi:hypothetical protein